MLFKLKRLSDLDTNLKGPIPIVLQSENERIAAISQRELNALYKSIADSAAPSIEIIRDHLNSLGLTRRSIEAIKLIKELSGLSNSYDSPRDRLVVSKIIETVMNFVPADLVKSFKANGELPSQDISTLTIIPKLIPDFQSLIKFQYIEEKKELDSPTSTSPTSRHKG
jgi:hypothetical protein